MGVGITMAEGVGVVVIGVGEEVVAGTTGVGGEGAVVVAAGAEGDMEGAPLVISRSRWRISATSPKGWASCP